MKILPRLFLGLALAIIGLAAPRTHASLQSATLTTLYSCNNTNTGANPYAAPVMGPDGSLYGTTGYGYTSSGTNHFAVIYKITPDGSNITLHTFTPIEGFGISAPLTFGADGNLYGVTTAGGANNLGTLFEITTNGAFTNLYSFGQSFSPLGYALDGSTPYAGLALGRDGKFYGTTFAGGISNVGTFFQFTPPNNLNTLADFTVNNGSHPEETPLVEGADGFFYGTTYQGGSSNLGTVFLAVVGGSITDLHQFSGPDGRGPYNGLTFGSDGFLYGTTVQGGAKGDGTVFRINVYGSLTTLHSFAGSDGLAPESGITIDSNNVLYGTTYQGGTKGLGTIFQITTNGLFTSLYSFTNSVDGQNPAAGVILGTNGDLYGTTLYGGTNNSRGTVYRLQFVIVPNLTITSPKAGQNWSNSVLQVTGTTSGNLVVTNVLCSIDSSNWVSATTSNNWATWSAPVNLTTAGTNTVYACAVDSNGNFSSTNSVNVNYFITATITVLTNGPGNITPNYNNVPLVIGRGYSITAGPAKNSHGFGFKRWTDGSSNTITFSPTLNFVAASNLTFIAFFADTNPPAIAVSNFKSFSRWSNSVMTINGTAKDNVAVSNVLFEINRGVWTNAATTNNWTNWSATFVLPSPGTNQFDAMAVDTSGNFASISSQFVDYILSDRLTLNIDGSGTVSPNYSNALLAISNNYTLKATPAKGFGFYFWNVGAVMSNSPTLTFTMASNLVITANFKDITAPTLTINAPKAGAKDSNTTVNVSGTASDNVGVLAVGVQINTNGWMVASGTTNWTFDDQPIQRGTNTIQAYAMDAAGNFSKTNIVKFIGVLPPDWAPTSLASSTLLVTPAAGNPLIVSFDATNFSQSDFLITNDSDVGTYGYSQTDTNMAELSLTNSAPLNFTNSLSPLVQLAFTNLNAGVFTNEADASINGTFSIIDSTNFLPATWSGHTLVASHAGSTNQTTVKFTSATAVTITSPNKPNRTGTYVVNNASLIGTMIVVTYTDAGDAGNTAYLQLTFDAKTGGHYEVNTVTSLDQPAEEADLGTFTFK